MRVSRYGKEPIDPYARVMARVEMQMRPDGCWIFTGGKARGYGRIVVGSVANGTRRTRYAHAIVYEKLKGEIPEGLELDHLCKTPACVNPDHLDLVTHAENVRRGDSPPAQNARRDKCAYGHEYEMAPWGRRTCRICDRRRAAERYARLRSS